MFIGAAPSRDVAEPLQLLPELLFRLGLFELGDLLFQRVRDELLDRRVPSKIRVALDLREQRLLELYPASEHHLSSIEVGIERGKPSIPNSATSADASVCRLRAAFRSGRLVNRIPGTASGSMQ